MDLYKSKTRRRTQIFSWYGFWGVHGCDDETDNPNIGNTAWKVLKESPVQDTWGPTGEKSPVGTGSRELLKMNLPKGEKVCLSKSSIYYIPIPEYPNFSSWLRQLPSSAPSLPPHVLAVLHSLFPQWKEQCIFFFLSNLILDTYTHQTK